MRGQHRGRAVITAETLGIEKGNVELITLQVRRRNMQMAGVDIVGHPVNRGHARNDAMAKDAERVDQLIQAGRRHGVPQETFNRRHRPVLDAKDLGRAV